jgi:hypothetical protein
VDRTVKRKAARRRKKKGKEKREKRKEGKEPWRRRQCIENIKCTTQSGKGLIRSLDKKKNFALPLVTLYCLPELHGSERERERERETALT